MLGLPVFGHHLHPGPPIFLTDSFPLSLALQLLGYTSISLFCKFTSIIMASKLFAMLASWVALSRPMQWRPLSLMFWLSVT